MLVGIALVAVGVALVGEQHRVAQTSGRRRILNGQPLSNHQG
jgi:hypothetical protein